MKKNYLFLFFLVGFRAYPQCNSEDLTLNFLGKKYYEIKNEILTNDKISDFVENMAFGANRKIPDYKANFDYIQGDHYQKFISFKYKIHKCFTNSQKDDFVDYDLKLIDNVVYKISVKKNYELDDESDFNDDITRLTKLIKKKYPVFTGSKGISYRFDISTENPDGDFKETGASNYYYTNNINNSKIWKINSCGITVNTEYSSGKLGGYALPAISQSLKIEFVNLNNTVLDNRGY